MSKINIAPLDWAVLIGYFVFIAIVGLYVGRKVKNTENYFLGSRRFGTWLMLGQNFGTATHADMLVSLAGAVYGMGFSAIWYQWKNLFATPFYWIMAPIYRRVRRTTVAEVVEDRYGVWMGGLYTIFAIIFFTLNTASMMKGAGKIINQASGGALGVNPIIVGMTVVFIAYSFFGGLVSAAWTDFFQGFLIIVLSFMLLPLGWKVVGGLDGMRSSLEPYKFSLSAPEGITVWFIVVLTINGLIGIMAQPHMLAAVGTGKDEYTCRIGFAYGNFIKRVCTIGWAFVGLIVAAMIAQGQFGTKLHDPEEAFGFACRVLLFPGALGLLVSCVLAANMSACSAFMVDSGALFTQGFYRKYVVKGKEDRHYLWVGRFSGFLITVLAVLYAIFLIERVLHSFLLTETMATFMGISILGGLIWRRANRWGALVSIVTAFAVNFTMYHLRGQRLDHWDPVVFCYALLSGVAALIFISLVTPAEPRDKIRDFLGRLDTPTDPDVSFPQKSKGKQEGATSGHGMELHTEPQWLYATRKAAERGQQLLIPNLLNPMKATHGHGFFKAYSQDLKGLLVAWGVVAFLVALAWLLIHL